MSDTGYVYRWNCGACSESGEWRESDGEAARERNEHEATHGERYDGPVVESVRIQRYPKDEAPGYDDE